ncbi:hypothetical protein PUR49_07935 [Streptomyces sp. BE147]|nr:hypothetical protein [Streptomyces sp. BE147]MEE1736428.1 hypothetical protein [Streptomyces sp. BE147]
MAGKDNKGESSGSGQHRREDPPLSGGTPPPGNSDGQVPTGSGSGKRRK